MGGESYTTFSSKNIRREGNDLQENVTRINNYKRPSRLQVLSTEKNDADVPAQV